MAIERRRLGRTDIEITALGLGCWQFSRGQGLAGLFWPALSDDVIRGIVAAALAGGIGWFDTAEAYGGGASERALAAALTAAGVESGQVVVATKWWPAGRLAGSIKNTIDERLRCLQPFGIDLYQIHFPLSLSSIEAQLDAMADLAAAAKIRGVGVSNFSAAQLRRAQAALQRRGLALASNQVQYSLVDRRVENNGVLAAARELGVTIIAYSPLGQGVLSGKFHDDAAAVAAIHGVRRWRGAFRRRGLERSRPLVDELRQIAVAHGATPSQVALAWLTQFSGDTVVAIPGATRVRHAEESAGALGLRLNEGELRALDERSRPFL
ncbi:MAG: aldo/keto reductase [Deltaproteobacteria bacterium]|nr:aldo/keto reductase [Deltaproteobacteria bacterium]